MGNRIEKKREREWGNGDSKCFSFCFVFITPRECFFPIFGSIKKTVSRVSK